MTTGIQYHSSPPFPKEKHWLFGSAYLLKRDALGQINFFVENYGDTFSLSLPFNRIIMTVDPAHARHVLQENNKNYTKSLAYNVVKLVLGNGILTSEGDFWRRQRRLIQPAFHKQKIAALADMMTRRVNREADSLEQHASNGQYVDMVAIMTSLTLDIIFNAIFSEGINNNATLVAQQITLLHQYITDKINQPFRLPAVVPTPFNVRERKAIEILDKVIYNTIDARKKAPSPKEDLLSMLLEARDEETGEAMHNKQVRDEVMTIFIAGNETTANSMAWTLYLLSQNLAEEQKMIHEIDEQVNKGIQPGFDTMQHFPYTKQVIEESMRLYPAAWVVGRRAIEEDVLGGYAIPKGTNILIPLIHLHRSADYWEAPLQFRPDRFAPDKRNSIDRFVYFPFGSGPRMCIGNNFAMMEMLIILVLLYRRFRFRLQDNFPATPNALITLRPKYGMRMRVEKRGV